MTTMPTNMCSYKMDIIIDGYFTSDSTMINFQSKIHNTNFGAMILLLLFPFNSHKINGDLEPIVVGKVLQNFKVRYKYFAVTQ